MAKVGIHDGSIFEQTCFEVQKNCCGWEMVLHQNYVLQLEMKKVSRNLCNAKVCENIIRDYSYDNDLICLTIYTLLCIIILNRKSLILSLSFHFFHFWKLFMKEIVHICTKCQQKIIIFFTFSFCRILMCIYFINAKWKALNSFQKYT